MMKTRIELVIEQDSPSIFRSKLTNGTVLLTIKINDGQPMVLRETNSLWPGVIGEFSNHAGDQDTTHGVRKRWAIMFKLMNTFDELIKYRFKEIDADKRNELKKSKRKPHRSYDDRDTTDDHRP